MVRREAKRGANAGKAFYGCSRFPGCRGEDLSGERRAEQAGEADHCGAGRSVRRNQQRFPADFIFEVSDEEVRNLMSQFATSSWGGTRKRPLAFTEHGAIMAATVLNSPQAVHMSVAVVRAFVKLRRMALSVEALARKVAALEQKYDANFRDVFQAILQLMTPPDPPRRKIGFDAG